MRLGELAKRIVDPNRPGMTPALASRLGLGSEARARDELAAMVGDDRGLVGVYLLGVYVVDDTDLLGDGEIYWFSLPTLVDRAGRATWRASINLPNGAAPRKCGSQEWLRSVSLSDPPLLSLVPTDDDVAACALRFAVYDDDRADADVPAALAAGLEVLLARKGEPAESHAALVGPVRSAIYDGLSAGDDDVLIDQDVLFQRGDRGRFATGFMSSAVSDLARAYFLVRDERRTMAVGPLGVHKSHIGTLDFGGPLAVGGRLSFFSRGDEVTIENVGALGADGPFLNRTVDSDLVSDAKHGLRVHGSGAATVVAFYTPPDPRG